MRAATPQGVAALLWARGLPGARLVDSATPFERRPRTLRRLLNSPWPYFAGLLLLISRWRVSWRSDLRRSRRPAAIAACAARDLNVVFLLVDRCAPTPRRLRLKTPSEIAPCTSGSRRHVIFNRAGPSVDGATWTGTYPKRKVCCASPCSREAVLPAEPSRRELHGGLWRNGWVARIPADSSSSQPGPERSGCSAATIARAL
jgi:hypothetical protein